MYIVLSIHIWERVQDEKKQERQKCPEAVDMNGRFQMQGGKNWFTEIDQCKPDLLGLSLAGNLVKPLLSLYGTKWRERGYGLGWDQANRRQKLGFGLEK